MGFIARRRKTAKTAKRKKKKKKKKTAPKPPCRQADSQRPCIARDPLRERERENLDVHENGPRRQIRRKKKSRFKRHGRRRGGLRTDTMTSCHEVRLVLFRHARVAAAARGPG